MFMMHSASEAELDPEIRALSLLQPWATLMALGEKRVETRSWSTSYRGLVAIAASKKWQTRDLEMSVHDEDFVWAWNRHGIRQMKDLPLGAIVCVGRLADCLKTEYFDPRDARCGEREEAFGNYTSGRYAWIFDFIQPIARPIPVKGSLGLYTPTNDTLAHVRSALHGVEAA